MTVRGRQVVAELCDDVSGYGAERLQAEALDVPPRGALVKGVHRHGCHLHSRRRAEARSARTGEAVVASFAVAMHGVAGGWQRPCVRRAGCSCPAHEGRATGPGMQGCGGRACEWLCGC